MKNPLASSVPVMWRSSSSLVMWPMIPMEYGDRVRERDAATRLDVEDAVLDRGESGLYGGALGGDGSLDERLDRLCESSCVW